jgi:hypothetical protein
VTAAPFPANSIETPRGRVRAPDRLELVTLANPPVDNTQALTHLALISAAVNLDRALDRERPARLIRS